MKIALHGELVAAAICFGSDRQYSFEDVIVLVAFCELSGLSIEKKKLIVGELRKSDLRREDLVRVRLSPYLEVSIHLGKIREKLQEATATK